MSGQDFDLGHDDPYCCGRMRAIFIDVIVRPVLKDGRMLFNLKKRNQRLVYEVTASHTRVAGDDDVFEVCMVVHKIVRVCERS